jgi:hypothetical protein
MMRRAPGSMPTARQHGPGVTWPVVEDEGSFYVMTMRNADAYARPHPETVFVVYQAEPPAT